MESNSNNRALYEEAATLLEDDSSQQPIIGNTRPETGKTSTTHDVYMHEAGLANRCKWGQRGFVHRQYARPGTTSPPTQNSTSKLTLAAWEAGLCGFMSKMPFDGIMDKEITLYFPHVPPHLRNIV